jgi:3-deoxy-D-manno-octulosonic acid (KDO) 8-phosphate synthase
MKVKPVYKSSFDEIFRNAIASAKIEGIRFDKKTQARIKKEAIKKLKARSYFP